MDLKKFLKIRLGAQRILIPLHSVHMVVPIPALHEVPSDDDSFIGMLNYHGTSISIHALSTILNVSSAPMDIDTPVLLCKVSNTLIGYIVTDVEEVVALTEEDIQAKSKGDFSHYVVGFHQNENESLWILSIENLVNCGGSITENQDG